MAFSKNRRLAQIISDTSGNLAVQGLTVPTQSASDNDTSAASTAYVTTAVAGLIDSAPDTLNTLNEIAAALNDDANFNTTVTNSIAAKLPLAGGTMTGNIAHAGDFTLDVGGDIILDADGGDIRFRDGGTEVGTIVMDDGSNSYIFKAIQQDADIKFNGNDGGSGINALTLDMSDAGRASFNNKASFNNAIAIGQSTFTGGNTLVDIHGSGSGVGANIAFANDHNTDKFYVGVAGDTTGDVLVYNAEDSDMIFATNNSERMRIMNDGKVGIGITNPSQILNLKANTPFIQFSQDGSDSYAGINFGDDDDANDGQILYDHDSRYMRFQVANAERIRIDSSGNVGIGSSTINAKLNVHGTIRAENERFLAGREDAAAPAYAFHDDADTGMFNVASNILAFSTSGTERMRITSDGKVFIGSSNSGAYGGLGDLVFQQSANDLGIGIINSGEDNTLKLINNGTVAKIEHNGAVPIQIKNANSVLAEFDTYAIPKMNFNFAHAAATYASGSTTNDELGNGQGVLMLKQQITVRDGSRILIWYDSGQILNSNQGGSGSANSNPQIAIYVTTNSSAPPSRGKSHMINMQDTDHFMYPMGDVGAARVKMNGIGATDTISTGGTYYIYMYGGTYNSGSYTFNYQHSSSNDRGASIIWAEVIA